MYEELKKLAEGMKGWDKMSECWPCDENGPDWQVGRLDEDDNRWPLLTVDTAEYDQEQDAPKIAQYYAAANPSAVLALIAENEELKHKLSAGHAREFDLRSQVRDANEYREKVIKANATLRQEAYRYRWIRHGAMVTPNKEVCFTAESGAKIYSTMPSQRELDSAIDAAMSKEAIHEKP